MAVILSLYQRELADHCSSPQPECGGPWGYTQDKALAKMVSVSSLACWGFLVKRIMHIGNSQVN